LAVASASALAVPRITKDDGNFHLDIGKQVQDAIKKHDPYFTQWQETDYIPSIRREYKPTANQTLSGIVGDFNKDGVQDVAVAGRNRTNNVLLVALSEGSNYKILEVDRAPVTNPKKGWIEGPKGRETGLWIFLGYKKPGWVTSQYEPKGLQLKADAFEEIYWEKASVLYYLKDGKFEKYTTAD
jgi:hypothetical protein